VKRKQPRSTSSKLVASARALAKAEPFLCAEAKLRDFLESYKPGLSRRVAIRFTANSCTMVSKYEHRNRVSLRIHHLFTKAPSALLENLVRFCFLRICRRTSRRIRAQLMDFVEAHRNESLSPYPTELQLPPAGRSYDLRQVLHRVRRRFLPELSRCPDIAWTRRVHRLLMGKWVPNPPPHRNLILINRLLDHPSVPSYYLEFVVFHELLHELMPVTRSRGRWVHHPPPFKERERRFPRLREAQRWEEENLVRLYRGFRTRTDA
jgi:hypothetical protein